MHRDRTIVVRRHSWTSAFCLVAVGTLAHPAMANVALPPVTDEPPGAGKRVRQVAPEYAGTNVYHTLYLPSDWMPGGKYPVIVEYAPNYTGSFAGTVEDTHLGFYQSGGTGYIWITMPLIDYTTNPASNAVTWWGDGSTCDPTGEALSAAYTRTNLIQVLEDYGGDPTSVFVTGFSRGAIAAGYIALRNPAMADIWAGFLPHSHHDGGMFTPDPGNVRLSRIAGRPSFITYGDSMLDDGAANSQDAADRLASLGFPVESHELAGAGHTDEWILNGAGPSSLAVRQNLRDWLAQVIADHPGTHAILGRVTDLAGNPLAGVKVQSGDTHWSFTDANGNYDLAGLIDGPRTLTVAGAGLQFYDSVRSVTLAEADLIENFQATTAVPEPGAPILLLILALCRRWRKAVVGL